MWLKITQVNTIIVVIIYNNNVKQFNSTIQHETAFSVGTNIVEGTLIQTHSAKLFLGPTGYWTRETLLWREERWSLGQQEA